MGSLTQSDFDCDIHPCDCQRASGADPMSKTSPRIKSAAPVIYGVVKLVFDDGYEGIVDLRPMIADGDVFEYLRRDPKNFGKVDVSERGDSIFWIDDTGYEIDFGADSLRRDAEKQAALIALAS
jgi:hypothetical protein